MPTLHKTELGKLRIYLTPAEKMARPGFLGRLLGKPLGRELVHLAKAAGILNATIHHAHYGYTNQGQLQEDHPEHGNPRLNIYVEMIDRKDVLEGFCQTYYELLRNKTMVYKAVERWSFTTSLVTSTTTNPL
ncbi:MAG: hypothetical protein EOO39_34255 [Cytophagaceae bacterium]|nr:MAG: hypothetical protein EOO39_34255 [Cytophagaceae bacterium]